MERDDTPEWFRSYNAAGLPKNEGGFKEATNEKAL